MNTVHRGLLALTVAILAILVAGSPSSASGYVSEAQSVDNIRRSVDYQSSDSDTLRLYRAFFDREPDAGGAIYWIGQTRNGVTPDDLAYGFAQSTEFALKYGTLSNTDFLNLIYQNMLGRTPDQGGFDYWLGQMSSGLTQHGVVRWVVANNEFINRYPYEALAPSNPGDSKNCSDFASRTAAQAWFDHHYSQFGDIAGLDQDNDLIACESLS